MLRGCRVEGTYNDHARVRALLHVLNQQRAQEEVRQVVDLQRLLDPVLHARACAHTRVHTHTHTAHSCVRAHTRFRTGSERKDEMLARGGKEAALGAQYELKNQHLSEAGLRGGRLVRRSIAHERVEREVGLERLHTSSARSEP
jgi:hypothetical protein